MATPAPVRSGLRMTGPEVPAATYAHPPLVECWLETSAATDCEWTGVNVGSLCAMLGPEWPQGRAQTSATGEWRLTNVMSDRALRLTTHGFAFGWLGHGGERYPRYESVRDGFVAVLDAVRTLAQPAGKSFVPQTWSVRYVNRIPRGTAWSTVGEWKFFSLWQSQPLKRLAIDPTGFQARWDLSLEAERGHLTILFRHDSASSADETESVWIELTASSTVDESEMSLFDGLDHGREVIVRAFNEVVSLDAKTYWGVAVPLR